MNLKRIIQGLTAIVCGSRPLFALNGSPLGLPSFNKVSPRRYISSSATLQLYHHSDTESSSREAIGNSLPFKPVLISVEGNIGAGKSTILRCLRDRHPEWTFIDEPVDIWTSLKLDIGESLLEAFYKDRKRWSYTFQNCALLTRYQMIQNAVFDIAKKGTVKSSSHIFLTERCLETDHQVFTKMLRADGSLDGLEVALYDMLLSQLKQTAIPVSAIVHVDTPPPVCYERIKQRSRGGEEGIPLDYLESLNKYQCEWVDHAGIPIIKTGENPCQDSLTEIESFIAKQLM